MFGFLRRVFFGMSAGITGLAFLLIKLLGLALQHLHNIFCLRHKGFSSCFNYFFYAIYKSNILGI